MDQPSVWTSTNGAHLLFSRRTSPVWPLHQILSESHSLTVCVCSFPHPSSPRCPSPQSPAQNQLHKTQSPLPSLLHPIHVIHGVACAFWLLPQGHNWLHFNLISSVYSYFFRECLGAAPSNSLELHTSQEIRLNAIYRKSFYQTNLSQFWRKGSGKRMKGQGWWGGHIWNSKPCLWQACNMWL